MLRRGQFQEQFRFLKEGICARDLKKQLLKAEGYTLEQTGGGNTLRQTDAAASNIATTEARHRSLTVKWAFGRFPPQEYLAAGGKIWNGCNESTSILSKKSWHGIS